MVLGVLLGKKSYALQKYLFVMMIVVGIVLFMYKDKSGGMQSESSLGLGEILLILSLVMDGLTAAIQVRSFHPSFTLLLFLFLTFSFCFFLFLIPTDSIVLVLGANKVWIAAIRPAVDARHECLVLDLLGSGACSFWRAAFVCQVYHALSLMPAWHEFVIGNRCAGTTLHILYCKLFTFYRSLLVNTFFSGDWVRSASVFGYHDNAEVFYSIRLGGAVRQCANSAPVVWSSGRVYGTLHGRVLLEEGAEKAKFVIDLHLSSRARAKGFCGSLLSIGSRANTGVIDLFINKIVGNWQYTYCCYYLFKKMLYVFLRNFHFRFILYWLECVWMKSPMQEAIVGDCAINVFSHENCFLISAAMVKMFMTENLLSAHLVSSATSHLRSRMCAE